MKPIENQELISVVIPIYKVEKYLRRCVESVRKQTYANLEIILVDDGSPDTCPDICDEYLKKDERIRVIHKKNGGLSDARNVGIENARGKYIGFVDSDDYLHPEMYECLYSAMRECDADVSICNIEKVYTEEYVVREQGTPIIRQYDGREAIANIFNADLYLSSVVAWNKLYKRTLFDSVRYPKGKLHEDEFTTYRLFYESMQVVYLDKAYYYYFQREDSIMAKVKGKIPDEALEAYEEMGKFFEGKEESYLLQLAKYRYLCFLKRYVEQSEHEGKKILSAEMEKKYKEEYKKNIHKIKKMKRRFRLWLYRWFKINL